MGDGQPQCLRHDLAGRRGAEELAAAAGRRAGTAAKFGGFLQGDDAVGKTGAHAGLQRL